MDRFPDSKHACAYLGLVPSLHQSGDASITGHITKDGNKFLRRNLIESFDRSGKEDGFVRILDAEEESNLRRASSLDQFMETISV